MKVHLKVTRNEKYEKHLHVLKQDKIFFQKIRFNRKYQEESVAFFLVRE